MDWIGLAVDLCLAGAVAWSLRGSRHQREVSEDSLQKMTSFQSSTTRLYDDLGRRLNDHIKSRMHR